MKQTTKRVVAFFAAMGLMVSGLSLNEPASADAKAKAKVKSVTIKNVKKKLTLKKGDSFKLKVSVKVKPNKAKYKKVTYKSSKKKVVKVSSKGKLTACQAGTAKITVRSKTNKKKKTVITVVVKNVRTENKGQGAAPTANVTVSPTKQPENTGGQTNCTGNGNTYRETNGGANTGTGWHKHTYAQAICSAGKCGTEIIRTFSFERKNC